MERAALVAEGAINRVESDQGQDVGSSDQIKTLRKEKRDFFIN